MRFRWVAIALLQDTLTRVTVLCVIKHVCAGCGGHPTSVQRPSAWPVPAAQPDAARGTQPGRAARTAPRPHSQVERWVGAPWRGSVTVWRLHCRRLSSGLHGGRRLRSCRQLSCGQLGTGRLLRRLGHNLHRWTKQHASKVWRASRHAAEWQLILPCATTWPSTCPFCTSSSSSSAPSLPCAPSLLLQRPHAHLGLPNGRACCHSRHESRPSRPCARSCAPLAAPRPVARPGGKGWSGGSTQLHTSVKRL